MYTQNQIRVHFLNSLLKVCLKVEKLAAQKYPFIFTNIWLEQLLRTFEVLVFEKYAVHSVHHY